MTPPALALLALMLSVLTALVALGLGMALDRRSGDPTLRDQVWAALLTVPLLPLLIVPAWMLTPAPTRTATPVPIRFNGETSPSIGTVVEPPSPLIDIETALWVALALALVTVSVKAIGLTIRSIRLGRLLARTRPPSVELRDLVEHQARRMSVDLPQTLVGDRVREPLLLGPRARLLLPADFETRLGDATTAAVIAHELAHLKRGDHRMIWWEETLATVMAFNPLTPALRRRRDAAREEACDALALSGAPEAERRAYAHRLIEALRDRAGPQPLALTFTGAGRTIAMNRLKAILSPAAPAGRRARLTVTVAGLGLLATIGAGSWAVAAQRPVEVRVAPPGLTPQQQADLDARYRGLSAEGFRTVCASTDATDQGYCAGVMFAQISSRDAAICGPDASDGQALATYVDAGKAAMRRIDPRTDEGAYGYAERVLSQTFPCAADGSASYEAAAIDLVDAPPAGLAPPPTGGGRLWVRFDSDDMQTFQGDRLVLTLSGRAEDGVNYEHVSEVSTGPNGELPDLMFVDLVADYFPAAGERRAYGLSAQVQRGDQVVYVSDATTLRLAPGSQGSLGQMRPVLQMRGT